MADYRVPVLEHFEWQRPVSSRVTVPVGGEAEATRYLVIATSSGAFVGQENNIAYYYNSTWTFDVPTEGTILWVNDEDKYYKYNGTAWEAYLGQQGPTGPAGSDGDTGPAGSDGDTGPTGPGATYDSDYKCLIISG